MPTLAEIQDLTPKEQEQFYEYAEKSVRRVQKRNRHISAAERQLETDPNFERNEDESEH